MLPGCDFQGAPDNRSGQIGTDFDCPGHVTGEVARFHLNGDGAEAAQENGAGNLGDVGVSFDRYGSLDLIARRSPERAGGDQRGHHQKQRSQVAPGAF